MANPSREAAGRGHVPSQPGAELAAGATMRVGGVGLCVGQCDRQQGDGEARFFPPAAAGPR
jgi:hypothetical protein